MSKARRIDTEIIRQFQLEPENIELFNKIYKFYKSQVFSFCLSYLRNTYDAEEVTQEIFILLFRKIHTLKKVESFDAWLFKTSYLCIVAYARKKQKEQITIRGEEELEGLLNDTFPTPEEKEDTNHIYQTIAGGINKLSEKLKVVAYLFYVEEFKIQEISKILRIPEGTVKSRLSKVRKTLQLELEHKGITGDKYYSVGFMPLLYEAFTKIYSPTKESISLGEPDRIWEGIASGGTIALGMKKNLKESKWFQIGVSLGIATVATLLVAGVLPNLFLPQKIKEIQYNQEATRFNIKVEILLEKEEDDKKISILHNEKGLEPLVDHKRVTFIASENGDYQIQVGDIHQEIEISNIDKSVPTLEKVTSTDKGLQIEGNDLDGQVDYNSSYIQYLDQVYTIKQDGTVEGAFTGDLYVCLYDQVGNEARYEVTVERRE